MTLSLIDRLLYKNITVSHISLIYVGISCDEYRKRNEEAKKKSLSIFYCNTGVQERSMNKTVLSRRFETGRNGILSLWQAHPPVFNN